jgi:hypothetical protein
VEFEFEDEAWATYFQLKWAKWIITTR